MFRTGLWEGYKADSFPTPWKRRFAWIEVKICDENGTIGYVHFEFYEERYEDRWTLTRRRIASEKRLLMKGGAWGVVSVA